MEVVRDLMGDIHLHVLQWVEVVLEELCVHQMATSLVLNQVQVHALLMHNLTIEIAQVQIT